jgi:hypothetical protein
LALTNARVGARDDANARHRRALVVTARLNIVVVRRRPSSVVECGKKSRHRAVALFIFLLLPPQRSRRLRRTSKSKSKSKSINEIFSARVNARRVASPCRDPIRASSR